MKTLEWALHHYDWYPCKKRRGKHMGTLGAGIHSRTTMRRHRGKAAVCKPKSCKVENKYTSKKENNILEVVGDPASDTPNDRTQEM